MFKHIAKYLLFGIAWGCVSFVFMHIILDFIIPADNQLFIAENFTVHALAFIAVGIASAGTSIVYTIDRLRLWQQITIHATVTLGVFFPIGFGLDWLPAESTVAIVLSVAGVILFFWIVWTGFYIYSVYEVKRINNKIKELDSKGQQEDGANRF